MSSIRRIFGEKRPVENSEATREVAIFRSNGERQTGWRIEQVIDKMVWVSTDGLHKAVSMVNLLRANPELLIGRTLRIQRSSGEFETDWQVESFWDEQHAVVAKDDLKKTVSLERLTAWNDWGLALAFAA